MKFSGDKKRFLQGLKEVSKAIDSKSSLEVIKNAMIVAKEGSDSVELTGINHYMRVTTSFPAKIEEAGSITVRADMLVSTLDLSRGDSFKFECKDETSRGILKTDNGKYKIPVMSSESYPPSGLQTAVEKTKLNISSSVLARSLKQASVFCDTKEQRIFMHAVNIFSKNESVCFMGACSKGMILSKSDMREELLPFACLLLKESVSTVLSLLPSSADIPVEIIVYDRFVGFNFSETFIQAKMLEVAYPDFEKRMPDADSFTDGFDISTEELMLAAKSVMNISGRDKNVGSKIRLSFKPGEELIISTEIDIASGEERVSVIAPTDNCEMESVIDGHTVVSVMSVLDCETVRFRYFQKGSKLVRLTSADEKNKTFCLMTAME